jgi:hypothetical protein
VDGRCLSRVAALESRSAVVPRRRSRARLLTNSLRGSPPEGKFQAPFSPIPSGASMNVRLPSRRRLRRGPADLRLALGLALGVVAAGFVPPQEGLFAGLPDPVGPRGLAAQVTLHEALQEPFFAWDEGRYLDALDGYLRVLRGPDGDRYVEDVARLTGELHPTRSVDDDGRLLAVSPDGRFIQWSRQRSGEGDGEWVTHVEPVDGDGPRRTVPSFLAALSAEGDMAWVEEGVVRVERLADGNGGRAPELEGRMPAEIPLGTVRPLALRFAPDRLELYLTGVEAGAATPEEARVGIYHLRAPDWRPRRLELGGGHQMDPTPVPGGRYLVYRRTDRSPLAGPGGPPAGEVAEPGPGILELATGRRAEYPGGAPTVSAAGNAVAWVDRGGEGEPGRDRLLLLRLDEGGEAGWPALVEPPLLPEPLVLLEAEMEIANPALAPEGRRVAYQARPHLDWEIFVVGWDGSAASPEEPPRRITREIQHDQFPAWIGEERILAMKGEFRHRRGYVYDLGGEGGYRLHHNNTMRTIAPEYEWVPDPLGRGVFLSAERDGDTIAPERAVFWVDLTRTVDREALVARLEEERDREAALLARAEARLAPDAASIRPVTEAVSVGRIRHYARDLHAFGSKFFTEPGNALAREYLAETLRGWGYEVELQWFEARGRAPDAEPVATANVVATLPGTENPEQIYVISSHFDSVLRSPGADDNSSGTTALLEAARVLADHPRRATIHFAFLTAEEAGLLGAREYVRRALEEGAHIAGVLNNDMIGWTRSHRLDNTIRYSNDGIRDIQHGAAHLFSDLITYDARYYRGTDAAVFYDAYGDIVGGIGSYPVLGNPNYHQPTDELWTINQHLVAEVARATVATILHLADGPSLVQGLHLAEEGPEGPTFAWYPSPEGFVSGYRVRVQGRDGEWRELGEVVEPRIRVPADVEVEAVAVTAVTADGRSSYDERRLGRDEW